jgi:cobalt/nickel transport system permease protein
MAFVILIAVTPAPGRFFLIVAFTALLTVCLLARIPFVYLLTRSAVVIPFTGFAAFSYALSQPAGEIVWQFGPFNITDIGLARSGILLMRAWIAVSAMILLVNTTTFDHLLRALRSLKIPPLFLLLLSFFYRYLYLLWDEAERLQRARNLRYFGGFWKRQAALLGHLVTSLFLRSYERAERVQMAMTARGWGGNVHFTKSPVLTVVDAGVLVGGAILILGLWLIRLY